MPSFSSTCEGNVKEMKIEGKFDNGLDVRCGAGSSTTALRKICRHAVGVDEAEQMLKLAERGLDFVHNLHIFPTLNNLSPKLYTFIFYYYKSANLKNCTKLYCEFHK